MKRLLAAVIIVATAACAQTSQPTSSGAVQGQIAELWTASTRTILTGAAARSLARQCSRISPGPVTDVWTPSQAEIQRLEDQLILLVARKQEERGESPSPGDYYRQYAGFVIGGRRIIYVNGVDGGVIEGQRNAARPFDWRTQPIQICDGGSVTFGAEYDPATRELSNFAFNGSV